MVRQRLASIWCYLWGHRYVYRLLTVDPAGHRYCRRCGRNV